MGQDDMIISRTISRRRMHNLSCRHDNLMSEPSKCMRNKSYTTTSHANDWRNVDRGRGKRGKKGLWTSSTLLLACKSPFPPALCFDVGMDRHVEAAQLAELRHLYAKSAATIDTANGYEKRG